jgi:hypothetical protein
MNRQELISALASKLGSTKADAGRNVVALIDIINATQKKGGNVSLRLGSLRIQPKINSQNDQANIGNLNSKKSNLGLHSNVASQYEKAIRKLLESQFAEERKKIREDSHHLRKENYRLTRELDRLKQLTETQVDDEARELEKYLRTFKDKVSDAYIQCRAHYDEKYFSERAHLPKLQSAIAGTLCNYFGDGGTTPWWRNYAKWYQYMDSPPGKTRPFLEELDQRTPEA